VVKYTEMIKVCNTVFFNLQLAINMIYHSLLIKHISTVNVTDFSISKIIKKYMYIFLYNIYLYIFKKKYIYNIFLKHICVL